MKNSEEKQGGELLFFQGPRSRWSELKSAIGIMLEFIRGFRKFHFVGPSVTVFGSARFKEDHPYYQQALRFAKMLAKRGFTIMTGGGPGIMEAANRGAKEVNGRSVGCNIELPHEQSPNPYLDIWINIRRFYIRKVLLLKYSYAFVVFPGGFGTLDEFFETVVLMQTGKINRFPLVLVGQEYWTNLLAQVEDMKTVGTISSADTGLFMVTDSVEEGMAYILGQLKEKYGHQVVHRRIKRRWWLGEKVIRPNGQYVIHLD